MTKRVRDVNFLNDDRGATAAEFAMISMLFMGLMLLILDLSRLAWELNSAKAAARAGVRYLVVNDMLATDLSGFDSIASGTVSGNGQPVPVASVPLYTCIGSTLKCTPSTVSSTFKQTNINSASFTKLVSQMKRYYGRVSASNVVVTYKHVGIGVAGNPCAPDVEPLITVSLTGLSFKPIALRVFGQPSVTIPSVRSSMTGESLGRTSC